MQNLYVNANPIHRINIQYQFFQIRHIVIVDIAYIGHGRSHILSTADSAIVPMVINYLAKALLKLFLILLKPALLKEYVKIVQQMDREKSSSAPRIDITQLTTVICL